jgi:hypothetical protein
MTVNGDGRKRKRSPAAAAAAAAVEHGREKRLSLAKTKESAEQIRFREFADNLLTVLER